VHVRLLLVFGSHVHGDLDNCAKSVLDAAQGIAFGNDKAISKLTVWREYDKSNPRAELWVEGAA
jgi:Holliday junction resolvase RusA-like endonuclease